MKESKFMRLGVKDFLKGLLMAVLAALSSTIIAWASTGDPFNPGIIWRSALAATVAYLAKNLLTNSHDEFLTKERK